MKLVDLRAEFHAVLSLIEATCDDGGVADPGLMLRLKQVECDITEKLGNYAGMLLTLKGQKAILDDEIEKLRKRSAAIGESMEWMKCLAKDTMVEHGLTKVESGVRKLRIQQNSVASLLIDEALLPKELYMQPPPVPDKESIREMLAHGDEIPGAKLELGTHLRFQ
ncbi:MAG: siphovirus Gp157 family protein [Acidiferrobacteraceae bacterium]